MKWASSLSKATPPRLNLGKTLKQCAEEIDKQLSGEKPDLLVAFISPHFIEDFDKVPDVLLQALNPGQLIGCSANGLIGGGEEIEQYPAVALIAAVLPGVELVPFHLVNADLPDLDDGPHKWEQLVNVQQASQAHFILLPDPFSFKIETLVQGLDFAFPGSSKIGGLVSGARRAGQNGLFLNKKLYRNGLVGLAMHGNLTVDTIVAQGCKPIGDTLRVSKSLQNFIIELDGQPAVNVLHEVLSNLSERDQELASQSLFLGIAMDEFKERFKPGDFLIRNIMGIDPVSGSLMINEHLRNEQTVQFHVRDATTSKDDLRALLKTYRDTHASQATGALLFSCLGRGTHLYGSANHDSNCFREYLGEIPLAGFFCNGEIGPVGGTTFLHGYTSSFGIFSAKSAS